MSRGNKRDIDRKRADARNDGTNQNSTYKNKESHADIMREKQKKAEEKKTTGGAGGKK